MCCTRQRSIVLVFFGAAMASMLPLRSQEPGPGLTFELDEDTVTLKWTAEPNWALQRSTSLSLSDWETITATLGLAEFEDSRREVPVFYRLVRFSEEALIDTRLHRLEERLTAMVSNQIQRAVDPSTALLEEFGETPPDDGDGEFGLDLFRQVRPYAWASQPGLIRVYTDEGTGFRKAFKLYSTRDSVASNLEDLESDGFRTREWENQPDHFTDLNEPTRSDGDLSFPIIDPRARDSGIEGFGYAEDAGVGIVPNQSLPMPAEWLYILKDGSLGTLDADGRWLGDGTVTTENTIVSRMAYWVDDETCKLNVNVASEGIPWDLPRADTPKERHYAKHPPVRGEIQRYPGHPAMTCLSSLLFPGKAANHPDADKRLTEEELRLIYGLTPRAVYREDTEEPAPLAFDDDPVHQTIDEWVTAVEASGTRDVRHWKGFITTSNPSPEITIHGTPRMSIWPLAERDATVWRSPYDERSAELGLLRNGKDPYYYQHWDAEESLTEFYARGFGTNVQLFDLLLNLTYLKTPGYNRSLASKYGAELLREDYEDDRDHDKDHYAIALAMFDHIRVTNLLDPNVRPFLDDSRWADNGFGMVAPLELIGRDLRPGSEAHSRKRNSWYEPTLEPRAAGRGFTLSEVALVAYVTAEVTVTGWEEDGPEFDGASGPDAEVLAEILRNRHPAYEEWIGRRFGPEDSGKTFRSVEVGLLPELFSPTQGYPRMEPNLTLRLLSHGWKGYLGGISDPNGLKINGVPLSNWGLSSDRFTTFQWGPLLSTAADRVQAPNRLPISLQSLGGPGGIRLLQFGDFVVGSYEVETYGPQFLPNGTGPLSRWFCQNLVVVEAEEPLTLTQEAPIQVAVFDEDALGVNVSNLIQMIHLWFAPPGYPLSVPAPLPAGPSYTDWSSRFEEAAISGFGVTDPEGRETIKGLVPSHGDHRHVAMKRSVPGQLFFHHMDVLESRSSHTLSWSGSGGAAGDEATARQGPQTIGRSLVAGVDYAPEVLPDFVHSPENREHFAPLLSRHYDFPIDPSITRDFDNGFGSLPDGPFLNRDDGEDVVPGDSISPSRTPYFEGAAASGPKYTGLSSAHHIARRLAPSPVIFGSIPSASQANAPWTCLLFRPNVSDPERYPHLGEAGNGMVMVDKLKTWEGFEVSQMQSFIGDKAYPPDHLWLDYFWMPTAEPEHTATVLATQGKVNLNYQMFPYTYIKRATALHAVLKSEEMLAIPTEAGPTYKTSQENPDWRRRVDAVETLKQFEERFDRGEIFMTESEICEQFLIPEGESWDEDGRSIRSFWDANRLTGDNTLERPYAGLYSRLTTRSNAFKLHFRIQVIEKGVGADPGRFDSAVDVIAGERCGAKVIERILEKDAVPDYIRRGVRNGPRLGSDNGEPYERLDKLPRLEQFYRVQLRSE